MTANEREALLSRTEDKHRLLQTSTFVNANVPWIMFMRNTRGWMLHVGSVLCSYAFLEPETFSYEALTPKCYEYHGSLKKHRLDLFFNIACHTTGFCFWTFPLLCAIVALVAYSKNFYHTRLYYESLLHKIMLMYSNDVVWRSRLTYILIVYGVLALCVVFFLNSEFMFLVYGLYIAPVVSLTMVFTHQWQVEAHIISLPKYYETDPDLAQTVLAESIFAAESHMRIAFEDVENKMLTDTSPLNSAEFFRSIAEFAQVESSHAMQHADSLNNAASWFDSLTPMLKKMDIEAVLQHPLLEADVSRPELLTVRNDIRRCGFWVFRLLHSRHLDDKRSNAFRFWSRIYVVIVSFTFFCIAEVSFAIVRDFFKFQRLL